MASLARAHVNRASLATVQHRLDEQCVCLSAAADNMIDYPGSQMGPDSPVVVTGMDTQRKPMKLMTLAEMIAVEKEADASGLSYQQMMENAGTNLGRVVNDLYGYTASRTVLGLVGKGNNGGDTLVALAWLAGQGWRTVAYLVHARPLKKGKKDSDGGSKDEDPLVAALLNAGGGLIQAGSDHDFAHLDAALAECDVLLDGVFGTGIKLPLRGAPAKVLARVHGQLDSMDDRPEVVAVDCPSGVDCEGGQAAAETLSADLTITMAAAKLGLYTFPAANFVGDLVSVSIGDLDGLPSWQAAERFVADAESVAGLLPARPRDAHKGTFGRAMVVAGSVNFTGAALLAGKAAFRSGAGWLTLAVIPQVYRVMAGGFPEATWLLLPEETGVIAAHAASVLRNNLERVTAVLVGPGLGTEEATQSFLEQVLKPGARKGTAPIGFIGQRQEDRAAQDGQLPPLIVDADGLRLLAQIPDWHQNLPDTAILTPHPGEMAVLTGLEIDQIQADRLGIVSQFAAQWGHVVVLKGAFTLVAAPDGRTGLIPVATPALARAGTGDVLAGVITGLRAQGLPAFDAALAGAWLHAMAGLQAESMLGSSAAVLAGDVLDALVDVLAEIR